MEHKASKSHGKLVFANGDVYEGNWKDDHFHGYGKMVYASGSIYEGMFYHSEYCGKGRFSTDDGCSYEGQFINNMFNGHGIMTYPNANTYEGEWLKDLKHGQGRMTYADGRAILIGEWFQGSYMPSANSGNTYELPENCPPKAAKFFGKELLPKNNNKDKDTRMAKAKKEIPVSSDGRKIQVADAWRESSLSPPNSPSTTLTRPRSRTVSYGHGLDSDEKVSSYLPPSPLVFDADGGEGSGGGEGKAYWLPQNCPPKAAKFFGIKHLGPSETSASKSPGISETHLQYFDAKNNDPEQFMSDTGSNNTNYDYDYDYDYDYEYKNVKSELTFMKHMSSPSCESNNRRKRDLISDFKQCVSLVSSPSVGAHSGPSSPYAV